LKLTQLWLSKYEAFTDWWLWYDIGPFQHGYRKTQKPFFCGKKETYIGMWAIAYKIN
jgi:hypothetical protein